MDKNVLFAVLPCYNEEKNISGLIESWRAQEPKLQKKNIMLKLLIVNDGSSDNTLSAATKLASENNNITVVNHEANKGLGEALNTGINYVIMQENVKYMCIMDGDMTQHPKYIHSMIDKIEEDILDCVIASRYRPSSNVEGLSFFRRFLSVGARVIYTMKLRIPNVRDYTCGYRLYKISAIKKLSNCYGRTILKEQSFACMLELLIKLNKENMKIGEVPFVLQYHLKKGQSKMDVVKTIKRSLYMIRRM
jgi:dolichol-phosphate mannosyltransferase